MDKSANVGARPGAAERPHRVWRRGARPLRQDVTTEEDGDGAVAGGKDRELVSRSPSA